MKGIGNASKRAVKELFSDSTDEMENTNEVSCEKDRRSELKNQFFGVSDSGNIQNTDIPVQTPAASNEVSARTTANMQNTARLRREVASSETRHIDKVPGKKANNKATDKTVTFSSIGSKLRKATSGLVSGSEKSGKDVMSAQKTGTVPKVTPNAKTGTMPKVAPNTKTGTMPKVAPNTKTGTMPRVSPNAKTGTMPRVAPNTHTGTMPRVAPNAKTGTMPRVAPNTQKGTVPRVSPNAKTGTVPRVVPNAKTGTIPRISDQTSFVDRNSVKNAKKDNSVIGNKSIIKPIVAIAISLCAVALIITVVSAIVKKPDAPLIVPVDEKAGISEESLSSEVALLSEEATNLLEIPRYTVKFTFYEEPEIICTTKETTVGELMGRLGIVIDDMKRFSTPDDEIISEDSVYDIQTVSYTNVETTESLPYDTSYIDVQTVPKGSETVQTQGVNGVKTFTYRCTLVNGVEESRELIGEEITRQPVNSVIQRGVGGTVTSHGQTYNYSYYVDVSATTYHIVGTTATGLPTSESVMAVDPRVIRLGSACIVQGSYGDFGYRIAADTGGDIKGNKIDIWLPADSYYAGNFGWRPMRVYILG